MVDQIAENGIASSQAKTLAVKSSRRLLSSQLTLEYEMAKKDPDQKMKYYESVRDHSLVMIQKAEEAMQQLKAFGDEFSDVFEKTSKRHNSLLNKVAKLIERDRKKLDDSAKVALTKVKKITKVEGAKPLTSKPKPPASKKRSSASQPEGL